MTIISRESRPPEVSVPTRVPLLDVHDPTREEAVRAGEHHLATLARSSGDTAIAKGLERVYKAAEVIAVPLNTLKLVLMSDAHKGGGDGADEFRRAERAYNAALAYYSENGYSLVLLGDSEELWKYDVQQVLDPKTGHPRSLALEAEFHAAAPARYVRIVGNHDDLWRSTSEVREHLGKQFPGLVVHEGVRLKVCDDADGRPLGELFLVHGNQGTGDSDTFAWAAHPLLRYIVRPLQRKFSFSTATPSIDWTNLREGQDVAMFQWAVGRGVVLISGHTHRPVFPGARPGPKLDRQPEEIESALAATGDPATRAELRADLEYARAEIRRVMQPPAVDSPPCYFNTGSCCFGDGDLTAIEISAGRIRLVRWPGGDPHPRPQPLPGAERSLHDILGKVGGTPPATASPGAEDRRGVRSRHEEGTHR
jgi:UDP-2,3-diacylglucosamine pyrophosphatase LpxH